MSVLSCDRNGCNNIMCDRCSSQYGYLCNECFIELVALGWMQDIREFMKSIKSSDEYNSKIDPFEYFDEIFPDRH